MKVEPASKCASDSEKEEKPLVPKSQKLQSAVSLELFHKLRPKLPGVGCADRDIQDLIQ